MIKNTTAKMADSVSVMEAHIPFLFSLKRHFDRNINSNFNCSSFSHPSLLRCFLLLMLLNLLFKLESSLIPVSNFTLEDTGAIPLSPLYSSNLFNSNNVIFPKELMSSRSYLNICLDGIPLWFLKFELQSPNLYIALSVIQGHPFLPAWSLRIFSLITWRNSSQAF